MRCSGQHDKPGQNRVPYETLAAANAKDMFRIVNNLISHQGKVLPSGDSDLALADKFALITWSARFCHHTS